MIGDERQGGSRGPQRFVERGARTVLAAKTNGVRVERVERGEPFRDSTSASMAVNKQLAHMVRQAVAAGRFPLVLAGSCDVAMGVLSGFEHSRCGVIWIDAHGDFNTPESTISGFFGGMSLAIITGHCYQNLWAQIGNSAPISETRTLAIGLRDLDPAERQRLKRSAIQAIPWHEGKPMSQLIGSLNKMTERTKETYLHIDIDALDPTVARNIVDSPVPGGLSLQELEQVIRAAATHLRVRAMTLATYNPDTDADGKTLQAGLRIIELIGECINQ